MARARGFHRALRAAPGHDASSRRNAAFQDFVPAYQPATVPGEESTDARHEPSLQCRLVPEAELAYARLYPRGVLPAVLDCFVAADVDEFTWEQLDYLAEHVLYECKCRFLGVEQPVVYAPVGRDGWSAAGAQPRVTCNRRLRVSRHLDFRDDRHVTRCRVGDEVAHLRLRVEPAIAVYPAVDG